MGEMGWREADPSISEMRRGPHSLRKRRLRPREHPKTSLGGGRGCDSDSSWGGSWFGRRRVSTLGEGWFNG